MDEETEIEINYYQDFYCIAKRHYTQVTNYVKKRTLLPPTPFDINFNNLELDRQIHRETIITVIFCALTLEAYINAIAINSTSKSYFDNYLDKLNAISKYIIIPKLLTGKEINKDGQAFELLKETFKLRDKLVHYKSRTVKLSQMKIEDFIMETNAERAIKSVELMVNELKTIEPKVDVDWLEYIY